MDAIGLAFNLAHLCKNTYIFVESVKDAPEEARKLGEELTAFKSALDRFDEAPVGSPAFEKLQSLLDSCLARLKVQNKKSRLRKAFSRAKWPFTEKEIKESISLIEQLKHQLALDIAIYEHTKHEQEREEQEKTRRGTWFGFAI